MYRCWIIWGQNHLVMLCLVLLYLTVIGATHLQSALTTGSYHRFQSGFGFPLMCTPATWVNLEVVEAWFGLCHRSWAPFKTVFPMQNVSYAFRLAFS